MKKLALFLLCLVMGASTFAMSGCESFDYVIGINLFAEFDALTSAENGFMSVVDDWAEEKGYSIKYNRQNALGDLSNAQTIASTLANARQMDLIFAIATPSANPSAAQAKAKQIPVLYTAVTDPVKEKLTDYEHVTGTSDMVSDLLENQMDMLLDAVDSATPKIAMLYCSSETNSSTQVDKAIKYLTEEKGIPAGNILKRTADKAESIPAILTRIETDNVDVVYTPTDNLIANNVGTVVSTLKAKGIPFIVGEPGMVGDGALVTVGIDYYKLGEQTGRMAIKILEGTSPSEMPWEEYEEDKFVFAINEEYAEALGLDSAKIELLRTHINRVLA